MSIELFNEDCMEVMARYPDDYFHLAITDPPYGTGAHVLENNKSRTKLAQAKNYKSYNNEPNDRPTPEYFNELKRVSRNQIIWGANHLCGLFQASGPGWIVWDKHTGNNSFSDCELAYTSFDVPLTKFDYPWNGMIQGFHGDKKLNEYRIHPSQKPIKLYQWLLDRYSDPGEKVIDTHLGSGSSAIASYYFYVHFVGCEIDEDYFKAAKERIEEETRQIDLFQGVA